MRSRSHSEPAGRYARLAGVLLLGLATGLAQAHPELLIQVEQLNSELSEQPDNAGLLVRRGDIYRREGNYPAAEQDFAAARKLTPNNPDLDFYQGRLLLDMGKAAEADELLSRYLVHQPRHATAWSLRGDARLELQQPLAAADDFAQAVALSERPSPGIYLRQANALVVAGAAHWPQALAVIDFALVKFPHEVSLLGLGTDIALDMENTALAERYISVLPGAVLNLPQWQERRERLQLLELESPNR